MDQVALCLLVSTDSFDVSAVTVTHNHLPPKYWVRMCEQEGVWESVASRNVSLKCVLACMER